MDSLYSTVAEAVMDRATEMDRRERLRLYASVALVDVALAVAPLSKEDLKVEVRDAATDAFFGGLGLGGGGAETERAVGSSDANLNGPPEAEEGGD